MLVPYIFINLHHLIPMVLKYTLSDRQVSSVEDNKDIRCDH